MDAVTRLQGRISIAVLDDAVRRRGMPKTAVDAFKTFNEQLDKSVGATLHTVWEKTAQSEERKLATRLGLTARFDMVRPEAIEAARLRSSFLIREITSETRSSVQQMIASAIRDGTAPREAAKQIRQVVGLTSRQAGAVINYRNSLREAGATKAAADKAAFQYARRSLNNRALTIARTETIRSSVDGQLEAWKGAQDKGLIAETTEKEWLTADDERRCPQCEGLQGASVLIDDVFEGSLAGPPAHPRCRCTLVLTHTTRRR